MKRITIKKFVTLLNRDTGTDMMPPHLWARWHGVNGSFYHKVWDKLDGDNDLYLFDDFCDIGFDIQMGDESSLKKLSGSRLKKLYKYSRAMLGHYTMSTMLWETISFLIRNALRPAVKYIYVPGVLILHVLWMIWVCLISSMLDFFKVLFSRST